jgi:hypothetical protein
MADSVDDILHSVQKLSASIDILAEDDPRRSGLIAERATLRTRAATIADEHRHPVSVENEISMLEDRLAEITAMNINQGYSEKHLKHTIQDPGAYSHNINTMLTEEHAHEVEAITARLAHLRTLPQSEEPPKG